MYNKTGKPSHARALRDYNQPLLMREDVCLMARTAEQTRQRHQATQLPCIMGLILPSAQMQQLRKRNSIRKTKGFKAWTLDLGLLAN